MKKIRSIISYILAMAVICTFMPLTVVCAEENTANYILSESAEKEVLNHLLYFDGETGKLYSKFRHDFTTGEITFSDPVEITGAICEKNRLTLTSDFQFYTDCEDGLALGEGTTLCVPEGASPSIHSGVSGVELGDSIGGSSGIYCLGNNTIDIDGSLTVIAGDGTNISSYGVSGAATDKSLTITGKGSLTARGGNIVYDETIEGSRGDSCGIYTLGDLNISLAEVNAVGGDAYGASFGIVADYPDTEPRTLTVSGGSRVTAQSGKCDNNEQSISLGCFVNHLIIKDNSGVTASAPGTGEKYSAAGLVICSGENYGSGKIELSNNSSLTAKAGDTADSSGIFSTASLPISVNTDESCTFTAEGMTAAAHGEFTGVAVLSDGSAVQYDGEKKCYVDADGNTVKKISVEASEAEGFPFTDVNAEDWFSGAVEAAYSEGLMSGVTETEFAPRAALTRGTVTAIIGQMGATETDDGSPFGDVSADANYAPYVAWTAENGIVPGFADGTFRPDENVTREQAAAILYRYMQYIGADVSVGENTNILSYTDAGEISEYAVPAIQWACGSGVMKGCGNGLLAPKADITRAEFAAMISRIALVADTDANQTAVTDASDFVLLAEAVPDAIMEIRYYSTYNFVGDRINGYDEPCALLTKEAAAALKNASDDAVKKGYRLKIYDAYRPQRAVKNFVEWAENTGDTRMKEYFYPELDKSVLFDQGYIAEKSGHSRGSTVDLTLFDMSTGKEVDMGGTFDYFGELSHPDYIGDLTEEQIRNRNILRDIMVENGFKPLDTEWWHFTLADEPYPDTYFDFPVSGESVGVN